MHWQSFQEFLAMGGYATYVWGSFGVTALCLIIEPLLLQSRRQTSLARLQRQLRAERLGHTEDAPLHSEE